MGLVGRVDELATRFFDGDTQAALEYGLEPGLETRDPEIAGFAVELGYSVEAYAARRNGSPVTLVYFDLDGFKQINDTYGHQAGDQALERLDCALALAAQPLARGLSRIRSALAASGLEPTHAR